MVRFHHLLSEFPRMVLHLARANSNILIVGTSNLIKRVILFDNYWEVKEGTQLLTIFRGFSVGTKSLIFRAIILDETPHSQF